MSKIKLSRKNIAITLENNTQREVKSWVYNDILAWHKGVNGQWVLTHLKSGYKLAEYNGKYSLLRQVTKDIGLISNWQTKCNRTLTELSKSCVEIIRSYE